MGWSASGQQPSIARERGARPCLNRSSFDAIFRASGVWNDADDFGAGRRAYGSSPGLHRPQGEIRSRAGSARRAYRARSKPTAGEVGRRRPRSERAASATTQGGVILVDTSIWIEHLRSHDQNLSTLLDRGLVLTHPFVVGELAVGNLRQRAMVLDNLRRLPKARLATDREVLDFIERNRLWGRGVGYLDVHLLVATKLSEFASFWTADNRLATVAAGLKLAHVVSPRPRGIS